MSADNSTATAELQQHVVDLQRDIEGLARSVTAVAQEKLHEVRETATQFCDERRAKVRGLERALEKCIVDRPVSALAAAAGAGFLVGLLWRRR
ncbi:MAG: hypothetical protein K8U03_19260 [Planctomycetia bacterium]|nr:hypothetical protein [Planctomycetia bacterium]